MLVCWLPPPVPVRGAAAVGGLGVFGADSGHVLRAAPGHVAGALAQAALGPRRSAEIKQPVIPMMSFFMVLFLLTGFWVTGSFLPFAAG